MPKKVISVCVSWFWYLANIQASYPISLAPVVQKLDSAIHWMNHYPVDKYYSRKSNCAIQWIMDRNDLSSGYSLCAIHLLNNWGLVNRRFIIFAKNRTFTCGTKVGNPKWASWAYHACLGIQSKQRIRFIWLACGSSHIDKKRKTIHVLHTCTSKITRNMLIFRVNGTF